MKHLLSIVAVALFAAGCVSNDEIVQPSPAAAEPTSAYAEMHAAIPASKDDGKYFEYN